MRSTSVVRCDRSSSLRPTDADGPNLMNQNQLERAGRRMIVVIRAPTPSCT